MTRSNLLVRAFGRALAAGILVVLGVASLAAYAQEQTQAQAQAEQAPLQEVVVTGTMIKRSDFETPSPVQLITAEDMQNSGFTSVSQVLSNLAANGQGTLSQSFAGAFASGASGIALRGLTVGATLTLIDGERMVAYPLSDDGERSFVDTSAIPLVAVDHIDVEKDGASSEYGSDAIAGVVNVILKKTFTGFEFSAEGGTTNHADGTTERITGIAGIGDLTDDGYNAYLALEYRHQDEIWITSRSGPWDQLNWIPEGGTNANFGAGSLYTQTGFSPFPTASGPYLVSPSATSYQSSPGVYFTSPACANEAALAADECTYAQNREQIQPQTGNLNVIGRLTKSLVGDWQFVLTTSLFRSEAEQFGAYPTTTPSPFTPGAPMSFANYGPGFLNVTSPITLTVPVGNPMNPTTSALYPVATLFEFGAFNDQIITNTYRVFADFKGTAGGWDLDFNLGDMYALTEQHYLGLINYSALQDALNAGEVFGEMQDYASEISPVVQSEMSNTLTVADFRGTRELINLPGGPLALGLGVGYFHRYLDATQSPLATTGNYQVISNAYATGGQTDYNAYGELVAPILPGLEVDASGRYDHYTPVGGGAAVPKFGVKYAPIKLITFRGTWGQGFRAPNPAEYGHSASAFLLGDLADSLLCPSSNSSPYIPAYNLNLPVTPAAGDVAEYCNYPAVFVQGTNPNLKPETSRNWTAGFILTPVEQVNLSVDYWAVKVNNLIVSPSEFPALPFPPAPLSNVRTGPVTLPVLLANGTTENMVFPEGEPIYTLASYENAGEIVVEGLDADLVSHFDLGNFGRISPQLNYSHEFEWNMSSCYAGVCDTVYLAGTHGPTGISGDTGNPKDRAVFTFAWDRGPWDVTWTVNYVGHYSLTDPSTGITTCAEAVAASFNSAKFLNGVYPQQFCNVPHFTYVNLYASYNFTKDVQLYGAIVNLFNAAPPVDVQTYGGGELAYNPSLAQQGAVGMFFNLGVSIKL
ncbi:MAG TPA: TonB-dependent receptor [Steroidobacteraceae bacterium]|nr:TonB-dependent receptor [Steroidobacteraceae bacterium]